MVFRNTFVVTCVLRIQHSRHATRAQSKHTATQQSKHTARKPTTHTTHGHHPDSALPSDIGICSCGLDTVTRKMVLLFCLFIGNEVTEGVAHSTNKTHCTDTNKQTHPQRCFLFREAKRIQHTPRARGVEWFVTSFKSRVGRVKPLQE